MTGERTGRERPVTPTSQSSGSLLLDQPFDARSMYQLRAAIAAHGLAAGMSRARAGDLVVAVHELAANVVRHGSGRGRVLVRHHGDELRCEIAEEGGQPMAAPDGELRAAADGAPAAGAPAAAGASRDADRDVSRDADRLAWRIQPGHGLWLVRKLADQATLHPGPQGVTTIITFSLRTDR